MMNRDELRQLRETLGMTPRVFARTFRFLESDIIGWERGTFYPRPWEVAYLRMIARDSQAVIETIALSQEEHSKAAA